MQTHVMDYLQVFFRRRYFFLYPFIITVFVCVVLGFVMPKTYQSTAVILIEEQGVINPLISGLAVSTTVENRLRVLREQILSWTTLAELVNKLKLDNEINSSMGYENLIAELRKDIDVQLRGPQVVAIVYKGSDPKKVQEITQTITEIFIQKNVQSKTEETDVALNFLKEQLKFYRRKIREDEIKRLKEQLANLLVDSKEDHPLVKDLRGQIARVSDDINKDSEDIVLPKKPASDKEMLSYFIYKELQQKPSGTTTNSTQSAQPLPNDNTLLSGDNVVGLPYDAAVNQRIYEMLLNRLETARITQQLENFKEGTHFKIIEPARLPLVPSKPNKIMMLLMGIVFGAGVGYGGIYLAEMIDRSYRNTDELKAELGLPVLGAISTIITEEEFNRHKKGAKFTYSFLGVIFILMILAVLVASFVR